MRLPLAHRAARAVRRRRDLLAAWRRLSAAERRDVAQMTMLIPIAALGVWMVGMRRLQGLTARPRAGRVSEADAIRLEDALGRALARTRRYAPYRGNCLSQSLALWWALRWRGVPAELRVGVNVDEHRFRAHAWVESTGRVLNDDLDVAKRFAPVLLMRGAPPPRTPRRAHSRGPL